MKKLITLLGLTAMTASIAGSALALNPQPLPPRHTPTAHALVGRRIHKPYANQHRHHTPPPPKHHRHGGGHRK